MSSPRQQEYNTDFWDQHRGRIQATKGGWILGEAVYNQGYSMLDELVGQASFFQVLVLNTVGRLPEPSLAAWLEALFICLSWPDARIWCNQVGSLAGSLRTSPVAAVTSGVLASDSRMYGPGCMAAACEFIGKALQQTALGLTPEAIITQHPKRHLDGTPIIAGYARPIATGDERIPAMERTAHTLDVATGRHLLLAYKIEKVMQQKFGESMNLAGYSAAFLTDEGFTAQEVSRLLSCWVMSGVHACYAEAADQPPESFFPLQCLDIDYQGSSSREVPSNEIKGP
jgi:hypothetical protein